MKFKSFKKSGWFWERMNTRDRKLFEAAFRGDKAARKWVTDVMQVFASFSGAQFTQVWQAFCTARPDALVDAINRRLASDHKPIINDYSNYLGNHWSRALTLRTQGEVHAAVHHGDVGFPKHNQPN